MDMYEARQNKEKVSRTLFKIKRKGTRQLCEMPKELRRVTTMKKNIQAKLDISKCDKSDNSKYFVCQNERSLLYSTQEATAPVPTGLYNRNPEVSSDNTDLYVWKPNVRLNPLKEVPSKKCLGIAGLLGFKEKVYDKQFAIDIIEQVRSNIDSNGCQFGIVGKNDCGEFATYLQNAIRSINYDNMTKNPSIEIGNRMKLKFNVDGKYPYHQATVIAQDGNSLITLEAHAGQDLTTPHFHIRNGKQGFINDYKDYNNGNSPDIETFEISKINKGRSNEYMKNYAIDEELNNSNLENSDIRGNGGRKIIDTVLGINISSDLQSVGDEHQDL